VELGAELEPVVDQLFRLKPRSTICLWEHALHNIRWNGPIIWTEMTQEGFRQCGAEMAEAEGIVNFLAGTQGSRVAVILYQDEDQKGWRVSLRGLESNLDVSAIAGHFGGGGHPRASGAHVEGGEAEKLAFIQKVADFVAEIPELETVPAGARG
jgi:phosphoesterase RecJ-like protein